MKTSSAKAKGRKLQQWTAQKIADLLGIEWGKDKSIASREMGQSGTDIRLIGDARKKFPWAVECKCQESWGVHAWIKQAEANTEKDMPNWLIIAKRNRNKPVVILDADVFFELLKKMG